MALTPEHALARRQGIGSSDAAAIVGLKPFGRLALDVYLDKLGLLPPRGDLAMDLGSLFEEAVAQLYARQTGREVLPAPAQMVWHERHSWAFASLDRVTSCGRIVECKTAGFKDREWGEEGTDQVPAIYTIQCQHQMMCSGAEVADVPCLFRAFPEFIIYTVPRNDVIIRHLEQAGSEFWWHVENRVPPPLDWSDPRTAELVALLWRPVPETRVGLDGSCLALADRYEALGREIRALQNERDTCKGRLIEAMQTAETGLLPDGREVRRGKSFRIVNGRKG